MAKRMCTHAELFRNQHFVKAFGGAGTEGCVYSQVKPSASFSKGLDR